MPIFGVRAYFAYFHAYFMNAYFQQRRLYEHYLTPNFAFNCSLKPLFMLPGNIDLLKLYGVQPSPLA